MAQTYLVTGATGFIGGHVVRAAIERGHRVTTIARPASDAKELESAGVTIIRGDLLDKASVDKSLDGTEIIVHCAGKVGDRGALEEYRPINVDALQSLLQACKDRPISRFIHMSSLGVYEARHHYGTDEREPLPDSHMDAYTTTKVEADRLVFAAHQSQSLPAVVLRPGFVYGPHDRSVLPRLLKRLRENRFNYLGGDQRILNCIYIGNLVDAVFLAAERPQAVGQAYNLTDAERITKERFINAIADALQFERPRQKLPRWLAALGSRILHRQIKKAGMTGKPWITPAQYKFLQLNLDFSIEKAKRELGYHPRFSFDEGMRETMAWYRTNSK
jgi:nucleoside-diphosphate-sugar epimerase